MRINYSRVSTYQRCPRLYFWRFVENLTPQKEPVPLLVGRAVHAGLAAHYAGKDAIVGTAEVFETTRKAGQWLGDELKELESQDAYSRFIVAEYLKQWSSEPFTVVAPEVYGAVQLGPHELMFRTDAVISWKGRPWLLEHKTTAQMGPTFFRKFRMDGQVTTYIYAVWQTLNERPVGAVINAIRKSRKLDSVEFGRDVVMRSEAQVMDFIGQLNQQVNAIEVQHDTYADIKHAWLCHTDACVQFNRTCDYLDLCYGDTPDMRLLYAKRSQDYVDTGLEEET